MEAEGVDALALGQEARAPVPQRRRGVMAISVALVAPSAVASRSARSIASRDGIIPPGKMYLRIQVYAWREAT